MKYVRVVLAVPEEKLEQFALDLEEFIEGATTVEGAYVSAPYPDREEGLHGAFNSIEGYTG